MKVSEEEIGRIATFLGLEENDFIERYTRLRPERNGLALIDQDDGACFFLKDNACSIQSVKPQQCIDFPNKWNFPGWRDICQAIPVPTEKLP